MRKLLIEAYSISSGGAINHLKLLLKDFNNQKYFNKADVLLQNKTKKLMPKIKNINYISFSFFEKNFILRLLIQVIYLNIKCFFKNYSCIFVTGSSHFLFAKPIVTINQNLLPFATKEIKKYFLSFFYIKLKLLFLSQKWSLKRSQGVIFLHKISKEIILSKIGKISGLIKIIAHNINLKFKIKKSSFKNEKYRLIYVSNIDHYKNQIFLLKALDELLEKKPELKKLLSVEFYGLYYLPALKKFEDYISTKLINKQSFKYMGLKTQNYIYREVKNYNTIFLFASTCENFSVALIEGMSRGYPILCVDQQPMKSVLSNCALFYRYNSIISFQNQLLKILNSKKIQKKLSLKAHRRSKKFITNNMTEQTYSFLKKISK